LSVADNSKRHWDHVFVHLQEVVMRPLCFFSVAFSFLASVPHTSAQEWTRFRGPNGAGVSSATTVPTRWTDVDYNWRVDLPGFGHSSPVLWDKNLFITWGDEETGDRTVACYDATSGKEHWSRRFAAAQHPKHKLNSFASPTPTVDADRVYLAWGTPDEIVAMALDHAGKELWRRDLGPFKAGHGFGVSPVLCNDLVVMPIEHQNSFWTALDKGTGEYRWRVDRESKLHYATPCVFARPHRPDELIFTNWEYGICGVDPTTGEINWKFDVFDKSHIESSIASPIVADDLVIGVCGYLGRGHETIAVRPSAAGTSEQNVVWRITRAAPLCPTPLVGKGLLFLWSDNGIVTCANVRTGKTHWQKRVGGTYYSSPICVANHIYNTSVDGECVVIEASKEYRLVARNDLGEGSHATPAVADGVMYLRTFSRLFSLGGDPSGRHDNFSGRRE
jgi:outer membrane protein assembly factor BamB